MAERLDEDEKDALASLGSAPPHRKAYSYSQQLRTNNTSGHGKRYHQTRKHSLDDERIIHPRIADDEFFRHSTCGGDSERLDLNLCPDDFQPPSPKPLQEVVASGGDAWIFRGPVRAAVHPGRPASLELRPHPLRETQVGKFLRTIACTETQLWAGQESGVRVWNLVDAYKPGLGIGGRARRGDEDAAPFYESGHTSPTLFMMVDSASKLVWSGHKDGKIRSWKMNQTYDDTTTPPFREGLSWLAHRAPVLSMAMTSNGRYMDNLQVTLQSFQGKRLY